MCEPIAKDRVQRFMRSDLCRKRMSELRSSLRGAWVMDVGFHAHEDGVLMRITFQSGAEPIDVFPPDLLINEVLARLPSKLEEGGSKQKST